MAWWSMITQKASNVQKNSANAIVEIKSYKYNQQVVAEQANAFEAAKKRDMSEQARVDTSEMAEAQVANVNRGIASDVGSPLLTATRDRSDRLADMSERQREIEINNIKAANEIRRLQVMAKDTKKGAIASNFFGS